VGFFSLSPGGMIGDVLKNALTGPLVGGMVEGYKAKIAAGNTTEKIYADLAEKELAVEQRERELNNQLVIADEGRWWTAAPRALFMWAIVIWVWKVIVWDMVLGLGTTPAIGGALGVWVGWLMALWFGGRTLEKVARIIKR
jgi:hypothetical protein